MKRISQEEVDSLIKTFSSLLQEEVPTINPDNADFLAEYIIENNRENEAFWRKSLKWHAKNFSNRYV